MAIGFQSTDNIVSGTLHFQPGSLALLHECIQKGLITMAEPYISFEELDQYVTGDPIIGADWAALSIDDRQKWFNWIHNQINQHPWMGDAIPSFVQRQAFPRRVLIDCKEYVLRFDNDIEAEGPCDIIIPRRLIADAIANQINTSDIAELIALRDIGVQRVKTGPLETEFQDNYAGNNPWKDIKSTLPEPLWSNLQGFSLLGSANYDDKKTFRIQRG